MATHANSISLGETCSWLGQSGRRYRFSVYDLDAPTLELDGVFVLAAPGNLFVPYHPLFIGTAENFALHLPSSAERLAARALGATTMHLYYTNLTNPDRWRVWRDLVDRYRPPLNKKRAGFASECELAGLGGQVIAFPRRAPAR
jgi:hypothetical protein